MDLINVMEILKRPGEHPAETVSRALGILMRLINRKD